MSISIGSKKVSTPATPEKKEEKSAAPAKVLSLGGAKKPAAVEENKAESPVKAPAAEKKDDEEPTEDWDADKKDSAPAPAPVAAAAAAPAPATSELAETSAATKPTPTPAATEKASVISENKTNFSRVVASTDADKIAEEAARVADADMLQELYGGEEADPNSRSSSFLSRCDP